MDRRIQILKAIAEDMKGDAEAFDGRPFDGKTVAEYFGNQGAAIAALADVVRSTLESAEAERQALEDLRTSEHLYALVDEDEHTILRSFKSRNECAQAWSDLRDQTGNGQLRWYNVTHAGCPHWVKVQAHAEGPGKPNRRPELYAIVDKGAHTVLRQHRDFAACIAELRALRAETGNDQIVWYDTRRTSCPLWVDRAVYCEPEEGGDHDQDPL